MSHTETGLGLGSNLGDRMANLQAASLAIMDIPGVSRILPSSVYETDPVDMAPEHNNLMFLNCVLVCSCDFQCSADSARNLLKTFKKIEAMLGRAPDHSPNSPRTIDIDILYMDNLRVEEPDMHIPHPLLTCRRFVLEPLAEVRPSLKLSALDATVKDILARCSDASGIRPVSGQDWLTT